MLLNLIQLDQRAPRASLNKAIAILQGILPPWEQPQSCDWHGFDWSAHLPRRRETVITIFNEFLGVSHLWAAVVHAGQHGRDDIWPGSPETLPRFLAYAEAIAEMASRVRWGGRDRRVVLPRTVAWRFTIPEALQEQADLVALPLHPIHQKPLHTLADCSSCPPQLFCRYWSTHGLARRNRYSDRRLVVIDRQEVGDARKANRDRGSGRSSTRLR